MTATIHRPSWTDPSDFVGCPCDAFATTEKCPEPAPTDPGRPTPDATERGDASMAVSKRTRYEVLKRDNHTCRYCGGVAPDVVLTVDHVVPTALGGSDAPDNLVAACRDCNYGKASTSPDDALVADVKATDLKWADAMTRVARTRARQRKKVDRYATAFLDHWNEWTYNRNQPDHPRFPLPGNWESSIRRFYDVGLPIEDLLACVDIACGNNKLDLHATFRYMAGCAWRTVTQMQEAAKELLDAEDMG